MIKSSSCLGALILGALAATLPIPAQESSSRPGDNRVRLGTFDSRAVAIAYYRSDLFLKGPLGEAREEMKTAQAAKDEKRVQAIGERMKALQDHVRRQGFGGAPVGDILERIQDKLPGLAAEAGVDAIVSKWDVIWSGPTVAATDVTDLLVEPFHPDQATREILKQLPQTEPVPLEDLKEDD
ncbi:MAG: hypothetical protein ACE5H3_08195 [Planctomycetota bacterium]